MISALIAGSCGYRRFRAMCSGVMFTYQLSPIRIMGPSINGVDGLRFQERSVGRSTEQQRSTTKGSGPGMHEAGVGEERSKMTKTSRACSLRRACMQPFAWMRRQARCHLVHVRDPFGFKRIRQRSPHTLHFALCTLNFALRTSHVELHPPPWIPASPPSNAS